MANLFKLARLAAIDLGRVNGDGETHHGELVNRLEAIGHTKAAAAAAVSAAVDYWPKWAPTKDDLGGWEAARIVRIAGRTAMEWDLETPVSEAQERAAFLAAKEMRQDIPAKEMALGMDLKVRFTNGVGEIVTSGMGTPEVVATVDASGKVMIGVEG